MTKKNTTDSKKIAVTETTRAFTRTTTAHPTRTKASHHVSSIVLSQNLTTLDEPELQSLYALFSWVANQQNAAEETVKSMTEAYLAINDITDTPRDSYDAAIRFLVDLRINDLKN